MAHEAHNPRAARSLCVLLRRTPPRARVVEVAPLSASPEGTQRDVHEHMGEQFRGATHI